MNYVTRIVRNGPYYFVEYKYIGPLWKALLLDEPFYWARFSDVPSLTLEGARKAREEISSSYELNYRDTEVIE